MFTPRKFAKETGLSYNQVLNMCKNEQLKAIKTNKGHFKIPEIELSKFTRNDEVITKEEYLEVVRENERLKNTIIQLKNFITNMEL